MCLPRSMGVKKLRHFNTQKTVKSYYFRHQDIPKAIKLNDNEKIWRKKFAHVDYTRIYKNGAIKLLYMLCACVDACARARRLEAMFGAMNLKALEIFYSCFILFAFHTRYFK